MKSVLVKYNNIISLISSNSTDYSTPLTANPNFPKQNKDARINILSFNSYVEGINSITFAIFIFFNNPPVADTIIFILTIRYSSRRGLRYLLEDKNETAICTPDSKNIDKNIKYSCKSTKDENSHIEQVAIVDIIINDTNGNPVSLDQINFSDEAFLAASNLQNYTKRIDAMYNLKNGTLKVYPNKYFVIKGDIDDDDYQGKVGEDLILSVYDNSTGLKNASCRVQSVTNKNYEFKCTSGEKIDGYIHLSSMYFDNKAINLHMSDGHENLSFGGSDSNGNTLRNNPIYKKNSSGLSGGAIAGIVIACGVALIIASIIAMMLRKPSAPMKNNSSIAELRTIDNFTQ